MTFINNNLHVDIQQTAFAVSTQRTYGKGRNNFFLQTEYISKDLVTAAYVFSG
jgi:hypothetical protein